MKKRSTPRIDWLGVRFIGAFLFVLGLMITVLGHIDQYDTFSASFLFRDLYANLGAELLSIAVTVLIIDQLYQRRETKQKTERLLREVSSMENSIALRALEEMKSLGLFNKDIFVEADLKYANLQDAVLQGVNFHKAYLTFANLREADLRDCDFNQAILRQCNLQGALLLNANLTDSKLLEADLSNANLNGVTLDGSNLAGATLEGARGLSDDAFQRADRLARAILPNGSLYDGRFNLPGDLERIAGNTDAEAARYYEVPLAVYLRGQEHLKG